MNRSRIQYVWPWKTNYTPQLFDEDCGIRIEFCEVNIGSGRKNNPNCLNNISFGRRRIRLLERLWVDTIVTTGQQWCRVHYFLSTYCKTELDWRQIDFWGPSIFHDTKNDNRYLNILQAFAWTEVSVWDNVEGRCFWSKTRRTLRNSSGWLREHFPWETDWNRWPASLACLKAPIWHSANSFCEDGRKEV